MAADLENNTVAQYVFITPNLCDDGHDSCAPVSDPIRQTDNWLAANVPAILNSTAYQTGGALFITWDEGVGGDGPIGMIVLSPYAKGGGYSNSIHYTHGSLLRTVEEIFGVSLLGDAAVQTDLSDLFSNPGPPAAPASLGAIPGDSSVALSWATSTGANSYNVKRSLTTGGPYGPVTSVTTTNFTDTGLTNGTTYYYVGVAVNSGGVSPNSNQASATPAAAPNPVLEVNAGGGAVGGFAADSGFSSGQTGSTTTSIDLSGTIYPAPQAVYQTWRTGIKKSPNFSYTLSGLAAGSAYSLRLHFAENSVSRSGTRKFDVTVNGVKVLSAFDVFAAAGGKNKAVIKGFTTTAT